MLIIILFALAAVSCSTSPVVATIFGDAGPSDNDAASPAGNGGSGGGRTVVGQACADAGGRCVVGGFLNCLKRGDQQCNPDRNPGGGFCCLEEPLVCAQHDYDVQILASDYDQSCSTDSDCVAVGEGNACAACTLACTTAAINQRALDQYHADIDRVGEVVDPNVEVFCGCPAMFPTCCNAGHCHADAVCAHSN